MLIRSEINKAVRPTESYKEWLGSVSMNEKIRTALRKFAVTTLSIKKSIANSDNWIRFPYYHHVFSDEVNGFERQIRYLKNFGEFIGIDDATNFLDAENKLDGRYFCLTFDDGLSCCYNYALPVISHFGIPATFYVVTNMVGQSFSPDSNVARNIFGFKGQNTSVEFLTWDQCVAANKAGITIGSHTKSHRRLSELSLKEVQQELTDSKTEIEFQLGVSCQHFCAPYGIPSRDFNLVRDGKLAKGCGYRSFATGSRGMNIKGGNPFALKRDHLLAGWDTQQLRYFFGSY